MISLYNNLDYSMTNFFYIGCILQTSTITEKPILNSTDKELEFRIKNTTVVNDNKRPSSSIIESLPKKKKNLPYGDIILVERQGDVPQNILYHSVGLSNKNLKWIYTNQSTKLQNLWYA